MSVADFGFAAIRNLADLIRLQGLKRPDDLAPTIGNGGTAVLTVKFDAGQFLKLSAKHRVTHAMLAPAPYRGLMERPDFDSYDLSSYQMNSRPAPPGRRRAEGRGGGRATDGSTRRSATPDAWPT